MSPYEIIAVVFIASIVALVGFRKSCVISFKKIAIPFLGIVFVALLTLFSRTAVASAQKGIRLWLNIVFPSLFPFFVASEILNGTGLVKAAGILLEPIMRPLFNIPGCGSFAFVMGVSSGYPVGAKITAGLRQQELLSKTEAERLLTFTNNSGPLFIIGAVSTGMFEMPSLGFFMLACHIASALTVGIIFRFYQGEGKRISSPVNKKSKPDFFKKIRKGLSCKGKKTSDFGNAFIEAVRNSMTTILVIGGYIILFSVIIHLLLDTGVIHWVSGILSFPLQPLGIRKEVVESILCGFFEITTGTDMASKLTEMEFTVKLVACSAIIGWAGLSVHSQVSGIISKTDISMKPYFFGKVLQGVIAGIYTYAGLKLFGTGLLETFSVFAPFALKSTGEWHGNISGTFLYLGICIALFLILGWAGTILSKRKKQV